MCLYTNTLTWISPSVWHIHYPYPTSSVINSASIWRGICIMALFTRRRLGEAVGVTLQANNGVISRACQDYLLIYVQWSVQSVTFNKQWHEFKMATWYQRAWNSFWICFKLVTFLKSYFTTIFIPILGTFSVGFLTPSTSILLCIAS